MEGKTFHFDCDYFLSLLLLLLLLYSVLWQAIGRLWEWQRVDRPDKRPNTKRPVSIWVQCETEIGDKVGSSHSFTHTHWCCHGNNPLGLPVTRPLTPPTRPLLSFLQPERTSSNDQSKWILFFFTNLRSNRYSQKSSQKRSHCCLTIIINIFLSVPIFW